MPKMILVALAASVTGLAVRTPEHGRRMSTPDIESQCTAAMAPLNTQLSSLDDSSCAASGEIMGQALAPVATSLPADVTCDTAPLISAFGTASTCAACAPRSTATAADLVRV